MNDAVRSGPKPPPGLLAGLLLGGLVACARNAAPPPPAFGNPADEQPVAVTLKLDDAQKPVAINVPIPDPVVLSKKLKQTAHWFLCPPIDAKLEIRMKDGAKPFKENPKSYGKHALSDPSELEPGDYKYTILVTLKHGTQLTLDPVIHVDP
jgi:hypothetical protein